MDRSRFKQSNNEHKDYWDWWLEDEKPPVNVQQELRRKRVAEANSYKSRPHQPSAPTEPATKPAPTSITVNINLSSLKLPKFKKPHIKVPALPYRRLALSLAVMVIVAGGTIVVLHWHRSAAEAAKLTAAKAGSNSGPTRSTPSFSPVAPQSEPNLTTLSSNNKDTAYDGNRDAFSYIDALNGNQLTVSEQPLPTGFGTSQQAVNRVAEQIGAKQPIIFNNGVAYLKDDSKSGDQIVVFSVKNLLIFINSSFKHGNDAYSTYINSLQ